MSTKLPGRAARRLRQLFDRLVELPLEEREGVLDRECADDPGLREEVAALLSADAASNDLLGSPDRPPPWLVGSASDTDPQPSISPGSLISHYRVLGPLGEGGMGVVLRARDERLGREVALKFVPGRFAASAEAQERLLREARAASALDHPNICTIYEVDETPDGQLFIAMACYDGESLAERLREGPLSVNAAVEIIDQVAAGLEVAHRAGIIHCDIKPANLMITRGGPLKVLDFGIARLLSGDTAGGAVQGTVAYMAPEQIRGEVLDAGTDVWALGVVLYECLTGSNPFRTDTPISTVHRILNTTPAVLDPKLPAAEALQSVLDCALSRERSARYRDAGALRRDLALVRAALARRAGPLPGTTRALPVPLTPLIGREQELGRIERLLDSERLITLIGPAGAGKTRVALEAARRLERAFGEAVCFVDLAPVADPDLVVNEIARSLGVVDQPTRAVSEVLQERIGDRQLLLVLDNFEQVVEAAPAMAELLASCPNLALLVTSRTALRVRGERELPLHPLPVPEPGAIGSGASLESFPATALFLERARAVRPDLYLDAEEARAIGEICRRLEGLPLALELAAARVRVLRPLDLLERLERRLDMLAGGARDLPGRHRTLRDAIAWSYNLLDPEERSLFRRMGLFPGGADLERIAQVSGAERPVGSPLETLTALVEHSLLQASTDENQGSRFRMLETVREYALERLAAEDDETEARRAHARAYLELAESAAAELTGPEQRTWLNRLQVEHDNLRAALTWSEGHEPEIALRLGAALWRFWIARGHLREGRERLERLLRIPVGDDLQAERTALLHGAGTLIHETGDFPAAREVMKEALAAFRELQDPAGIAATLNNLAWTQAHVAPLDEAEETAREALALCRERGDDRGRAVAINNLAWISYYRGDARQGIALADEGLAFRERLGDRRGIAFVLAFRARPLRQALEFVAAHRSLDRAEDIIAELDDPQLFAVARMNRGETRMAEGHFAAAAEELSEAIELWRAAPHDYALGDCLNWLAAARLELGLEAESGLDLDRAEEVWTRTGSHWGRAGCLYVRGRRARRAGKPDAAEPLKESLRLRRRIGNPLGIAECLEELALLDERSGDPARAGSRLDEAEAIRNRLGAPLPPWRVSEIEELRSRIA